ncbi:MAG: peptidylprolyl isomerase [Candidatus Hydrogenedentota bacterium]
MQKHRRIVMVFIILFVGLPLAFMVPGVGSSDRDVSLVQGTLPVITVGDTVVTAGEFMQLYTQYTDQQSRSGFPTDPVVLWNDGSVQRIVEQLIQRAMIAHGASGNPVHPEKEYLSKQLQGYAMFKDATGQFNPALYNQWVEGNTRGGISWDNVFSQVAEDTNRAAYLELIQASSFVAEGEIRDQYVRSQQKLKVKYVAIAPNTDRSEEQLQAFYDEEPERFNTLEARRIEFVSFPIVAPEPADAQTALERARAGEDFVRLVEEYSMGSDNHLGGDMDWIAVTDTPTPQQEVIFALSEGEVSDVFEFGTQYHIYKVEETRINEEDDSMEVHARRIVFIPTIEAEEIAAKREEADAFLVSVGDADGDLAVAASAAGLLVSTSGAFDVATFDIEGFHNNDVFSIRQAMSPLVLGEVSANVIRGRRNLFVAKVVEIIEPKLQTLEEAREDVEAAAIIAYKLTEDYRDEVNGYVSRISAEAETLDDIATVVPELETEIKETREFGVGDFLFSDGIFWNSQEAFALMIGKEPGSIAGPLVDFQQVSHFLELVERNEPEESVMEEQWQEAKVIQLANARLNADTERQLDYLQYLSEQAQHVQGLVYRDDNAIKTLLGLDQPQDLPTEVITEELATDEVVVN